MVAGESFSGYRPILSLADGGYTTQIMSAREPELPWYQFSLRSLLLLTVVVAVLCAIGVGTDWCVAAVIGVSGIAGGIVARRSVGFLLGVLAGNVGTCFASFVACTF